jgi:FkbM family methyltransferase
VNRLRGRIQPTVRRLLDAAGLEVHRTQTGVRRTLPAVLAQYRSLGLSPATVIDVGVGPGTPELYAAFPGVRLVLVEPLEEWRGHLEEIQRTCSADVVIAAAGSRPGSMEIAVHRVPACSSMFGARQGDGSPAPRRSVPVITLDELVAERGATGPYVVKVDVEGGELEVLGGADGVLREAELVLLEVSLFQLVPEAPQLHDVVAWMHDHGFVVAALYNGHNRPLDGQLAQIDIAFVSDHGRFRREHAYATAAQADALYEQWGF